MIKGLHHNAYRCRDSEQTRRFYEDFLGLPLSAALELHETKTGRPVRVLHTFYALGDGSFLAFFEAPDQPFEFKEQDDFDLHIALEVEPDALAPMLEKGQAGRAAERAASPITTSCARSTSAIPTATSSSSRPAPPATSARSTRASTTPAARSPAGRPARHARRAPPRRG